MYICRAAHLKAVEQGKVTRDVSSQRQEARLTQPGQLGRGHVAIETLHRHAVALVTPTRGKTSREVVDVLVTDAAGHGCIDEDWSERVDGAVGHVWKETVSPEEVSGAPRGVSDHQNPGQPGHEQVDG